MWIKSVGQLKDRTGSRFETNKKRRLFVEFRNAG